MKQIKIENNGVEQLITVPENSRVTIDGNVVVFEPKFKKGDVLTGEYKGATNVIILDSIKNSIHYICRYSISHNALNQLNNSMTSNFNLRSSTASEKQLLFDALAKEGKQWNAEKLCIEDLKIVPKVGDYVVLKATNLIIYCKVVESYCDIIKFKLCLKNGIVSSIGSWELNISGCEEKILSKEQFQSELAQLGFEYNFENDTISELKWKPKDGDSIWLIYFSNHGTARYRKEIYYSLDYQKAYFENRMIKNTEIECVYCIDKIKQVLNEK